MDSRCDPVQLPQWLHVLPCIPVSGAQAGTGEFLHIGALGTVDLIPGHLSLLPSLCLSLSFFSPCRSTPSI